MQNATSTEGEITASDWKKIQENAQAHSLDIFIQGKAMVSGDGATKTLISKINLYLKGYSRAVEKYTGLEIEFKPLTLSADFIKTFEKMGIKTPIEEKKEVVESKGDTTSSALKKKP